jgi:type IV secretory pathway protease TraF
MWPVLTSWRSWFRVAAFSALGLALWLFLFPEFLSLFLAVNLTPSLPRGLYRVTSLEVRRGALVTFCLPPALMRRHGMTQWIAPGRCPGGKAPLCKRIAVVGPGQTACGRTVWEVPEGHVFVRGDSVKSQDSCIFGPVPVAWLRDGVVPVWTQP